MQARGEKSVGSDGRGNLLEARKSFVCLEDDRTTSLCCDFQRNNNSTPPLHQLPVGGVNYIHHRGSVLRTAAVEMLYGSVVSLTTLTHSKLLDTLTH